MGMGEGERKGRKGAERESASSLLLLYFLNIWLKSGVEHLLQVLHMDVMYTTASPDVHQQ